jgi:transposase
MDHFAGLDVSVKETSICIVDETGRIVGEVKVASEPEALLQVLMNPAYHFKRIGLEAGPLSQWLFSALGEAGLPVICVETRHMQAVLKAQINKTDRNDARGIAQMMRVGLYRPVHVKTLRSQKLRMLLTHRKLLQSKAIAIDNDLRGTLRNFGLKVGMVGTVKFEARIKELVENFPDLAVLVEPLLVVRRVLREQLGILHRRLLAIVRDDDVCRRLMTTPGVGPRSRADLSRHRRRASPLQELQGSRGGVWTDTVQVSIGRDQPNRRDIAVWRRDDAHDALRSGPEHAGAFSKMVLAQGLGDEDCQAPRDEKGDRGAGASVGRGHASHLG